MDLLIFWLTPVILAVVLILVSLSHRPKTKLLPLTLIEPLGTLFKDWRLARRIGSEKRLADLTNYFSATELDQWSRLGEIVKGDAQLPSKVALVKTEPLSLLGEKRLIEVENKTISVIIGLPAEVLGQIETIDPKAAAEATRAEANGILTLHVGEVVIHGRDNQFRHRYIGSLLFEPIFEPSKLEKLIAWRWLSVLPSTLLAHYATQLPGTEDGHFYDATEITQAPPQEAEERLAAAKVIGSANLRDRYQIVCQYQRQHDCRFWSRNPADRKLPLSIHDSVG